jgi:hypothetical protein
VEGGTTTTQAAAATTTGQERRHTAVKTSYLTRLLMFTILVRNSRYTSVVPGEQEMSLQLLTLWQYVKPVVLLDMMKHVKL